MYINPDRGQLSTPFLGSNVMKEVDIKPDSFSIASMGYSEFASVSTTADQASSKLQARTISLSNVSGFGVVDAHDKISAAKRIAIGRILDLPIKVKLFVSTQVSPARGIKVS